jgi:hypothetical protein
MRVAFRLISWASFLSTGDLKTSLSTAQKNQSGSVSTRVLIKWLNAGYKRYLDRVIGVSLLGVPSNGAPLADIGSTEYGQVIAAWLGFNARHVSDLRSCPMAWCKSGGGIALSGRYGRVRQAATAGRLTMGSSLKGAMVSRVM